MTFTAVAKVMEPSVKQEGNTAKLDRIRLMRKNFWVKDSIRFEPTAIQV